MKREINIVITIAAIILFVIIAAYFSGVPSNYTALAIGNMSGFTVVFWNILCSQKLNINNTKNHLAFERFLRQSPAKIFLYSLSILFLVKNTILGGVGYIAGRSSSDPSFVDEEDIALLCGFLLAIYIISIIAIGYDIGKRCTIKYSSFILLAVQASELFINLIIYSTFKACDLYPEELAELYHMELDTKGMLQTFTAMLAINYALSLIGFWKGRKGQEAYILIRQINALTNEDKNAMVDMLNDAISTYKTSD